MNWMKAYKYYLLFIALPLVIYVCWRYSEIFRLAAEVNN